MIKNYLRLTLRQMSRNKLSASINIGGLALGMAVAMLIGLWIYGEVSYSHQYPNHKRIAAVMQNQDFNGTTETWWGEALQLGPELETGYSNLFEHVVMAGGRGDRLLSYADKKFKAHGEYMGPQVLDMLSAKMIQGSRAALHDPSSIVISDVMAKRIFGDADPLGKSLTIDSKVPVKVAGVYAHFPENSDFGELQFIAPWQLLVSTELFDKRLGWGNSWFQTFVTLKPGITMKQASAAIRNVKLQKGGADNARFKPVLFLHPLDDWHLHSEFKNGSNASGGAIQYVRLFAIIGGFVLLLACINFMNLSTARSEKRAKEVGIRKAIGSLRAQLLGQFFFESVLIALFAFVLSIGLVQLLLPFFNEMSPTDVVFPWGQPLFWLTGVAFTFLTGVLAGIYPALYLSSFRPVKVLKGTFRVGRFAAMPRRVLVVVQFSVSVILIIGTLVVFRQIAFVKDRPVGYDRAGLVMMPVKSNAFRDHYEAFQNDVMRTGVIESMAQAESPITNMWSNNSGFTWTGKDPNMTDAFETAAVSPEYGKVARWQIVQGRDFSRAFATDSMSFVINEAAVKYMGLKNPVGERIKWGDNGYFTVIGVVRDMVMQSPFEPVAQTIFYQHTSWSRTNFVNLRIRPGVSIAAALGSIGAVYKKYETENAFEYQFADQEYARKFSNEERIGKMAGAFTALAILISCLGLFGLASFVAEQRTREIGVRKVLGATVFGLWGLLSGEFVRLVALSLLIGGPLAAWMMHVWLQGYAYHSGLAWWIFAAAGGGAFLVTLLTVSFQAVRAALANPVKSLRTE